MTLASELVKKKQLTNSDLEIHERAWESDYPSPDFRPTFVQHILEAKRKSSSKSDAANLRDSIEQTEASRTGDLDDEDLKGVLHAITNRSVVFFVGAGFSMSADQIRSASGWKLREELAKMLAKRDPEGNSPERFSGLSLPQIALRLERIMGRKSFEQSLYRWCERTLPRSPLSHHRALAKLSPSSHIVTTNWDHLIERAYGEDAISVIREGGDLPAAPPGVPKLIKLHGDINYRLNKWTHSPVCTDEDILSLKNSDQALYSYMQSLFLTHTIIIIGFHPSDFNLYQFLNFSSRHLGGDAPRPFVVDPDPQVLEGIPGPEPGHICMDASNFLGTIEKWQRLCNGVVGVAHRSIRKKAPCSRVWAGEQVETAKRVLGKYPNLRRVEVVQTIDEQDGREGVNRMVGSRGARILEEWSGRFKKVVVSCGSTLASMIDQVDTEYSGLDDLEIRSASILMADFVHETSPPNLVTRFAQRLEHRDSYGIAHQVPSVLGYLLAPDRLKHYMRMPSRFEASPLPKLDKKSLSVLSMGMKYYLREAAKSDMFFLGVGSVPSAYKALDRFALYCLRSCGFWDENRDSVDVAEKKMRNYFARLQSERGYVGDVMFRMIRNPSLGSEVSPKNIFVSHEEVESCLDDPGAHKTSLFKEFFARVNSHAMSLAPTELVQATADESRLVCLLCSGRGKAVPLHLLLKAGLGNNIVIDEALADELLQQ